MTSSTPNKGIKTSFLNAGRDGYFPHLNSCACSYPPLESLFIIYRIHALQTITMSYAEAAARGPKQSPEEVCRTTRRSNSLTLLTLIAGVSEATVLRFLIPRKLIKPVFISRAPEINRVYKDEGESTASLIDVDSPHVQSVDSDFLQQNVQTSTQAERIEREEKETREAREKKAKAKASRGHGNETNPVYLGNAAILALVSAGLGFGAYHKHAQGKLSWELVGLWTGAVGAFGAVDYFVSK